MIRRNFWKSLKKFCRWGSEPPQNFRKFQVDLNPTNRVLLNFAKSCVLSCLSKVDNIKNIHCAVFKLKAPKSVVFLAGHTVAMKGLLLW